MNVILRHIEEADNDSYIELEKETWVEVNLLEDENEADKVWVNTFTMKTEITYTILGNNEICGFCSIKHIDQDEKEISIEIFKCFQHQGVGYQALKILLEICEKEYHMKSVKSKVYPDNYPSILLMRKVGAMPYGIERNVAVEEQFEKEFQENNRELISDNLSKVANIFRVDKEKMLSQILCFKIDIPIRKIQFDLCIDGDVDYKKEIETKAMRFMYQKMINSLKTILISCDGSKESLNEEIQKLIYQYEKVLK